MKRYLRFNGCIYDTAKPNFKSSYGYFQLTREFAPIKPQWESDNL